MQYGLAFSALLLIVLRKQIKHPANSRKGIHSIATTFCIVSSSLALSWVSNFENGSVNKYFANPCRIVQHQPRRAHTPYDQICMAGWLRDHRWEYHVARLSHGRRSEVQEGVWLCLGFELLSAWASLGYFVGVLKLTIPGLTACRFSFGMLARIDSCSLNAYQPSNISFASRWPQHEEL